MATATAQIPLRAPRKKRKRVTSELRERICHLLGQGQPLNKIATDTELSIATVSRINSRDRAVRPRTRITPEVENKILELHARGWKQAEIGKDLHIGHTTMTVVYGRLGVKAQNHIRPVVDALDEKSQRPEGRPQKELSQETRKKPQIIPPAAQPAPKKPQPEKNENPAPKAENVFTVKINFPLLRSLRECACARGLSPEGFIAEAAELSAVEFRAQKIPPALLSQPSGRVRAAEAVGTESWRRKLDAAMVQKILHLLDEAVPVASIAERFAISKTSVRKIEEIHKAQETRVRHAPRPAHGLRWTDGMGMSSGKG
jgi:hypothetical protein